MTAEFMSLLAALGRDLGERMSLGFIRDGAFRCVVTTVGEAPAIVAALADGDCYYGTGVLAEHVTSGRGTAQEVIGIRELYADLDVKAGGMPSYAAAQTVIDELAAMLGVAPVAVVRAGHGLQPHWALERDEGTDWPDPTSTGWRDAQALTRRWGRLVAAVAERYGGAVDNVYDLSRMLRAPGTMNRKGEPVPVTMTETGGGLLNLERLRDVLGEYDVPETPEDGELLDAVQSEPTAWTFAEHTCGYVRGMARGWATDKPSERHPWLVSQSTRLAAAWRNGCISEADYGGGLDVLAERFRTRLNVGRKRREHRGEIAGAMAWGRQRVATFTDERVLAELGGHVHPGQEPLPPLAPVGIADVHETFRHWFGPGYDSDVLNAVLAAVAVGFVLDGEPTNLLVVGGSGAAKTETLSPLAAAGAIVTSTITSEGALLSGTSSKERTAGATGGLLRKLGAQGVLVLKDVTSIMSMNRDARAAVLAALREVTDGYWERNLGVDGGQTLTWRGRATIVGAVTSAWDEAHGVVAAMGDRFPLVRMPTDNALETGRQALANTGREAEMRAALAESVGGLLQHVQPVAADPAAYEYALPLANIVTWARTAVVTDYRGDVLDAHAREMPTRFAKQLAQLHRGALCIGLAETDAHRIVMRVASDSMPPPRRIVLRGLLHQSAPSTSTELARRLNRPRTSVDQQLQALVALGLAAYETADGETGWRWRLCQAVDREALSVLVLPPGDVGRPPDSAESALSASTTPPDLPTTSSTFSINTPSTNVSRQPDGARAAPTAAAPMAGIADAELGPKCPDCGWRRNDHRRDCQRAA